MMQDVLSLMLVNMGILLIVIVMLLLIIFKSGFESKRSKVTTLLLLSSFFLLFSAIFYLFYTLFFVPYSTLASQIMYRGFLLFDSLHLLLLIWAFSVFKGGESNWNTPKLVLVSSLLTSLILFGLLTPDAIQTMNILGSYYIVLGPYLSVIYYPLRIFLPVIALLLSFECVSLFRHVDYVLARLSFTFLLGSIIINLGSVVGQIQLYLQGYPPVQFCIFSSAVGLGMMLYVASQNFESYPLSMTLAGLVRMSQSMDQYRTASLIPELDWTISLITEWGIPTIMARLLTLKGLILIHNSAYSHAKNVLTDALEIATVTGDSSMVDELNGFLKLVGNRPAVDEKPISGKAFGSDSSSDIYEAFVYLEERERINNFERINAYLGRTLHFIQTYIIS